MRRTAILVALTAALLSLALSAAAAASSPPRGVLTKIEYRELEASFRAMKHVAKEGGTPTHIARHTCRALTNATRLTAAEHAECEASLIFTYRFFTFPYEAEHCQKRPTSAGEIRCTLAAVKRFEKAVRVFIRTDAASTRAADPRGFTRRCLNYLIFTRQQARTTKALATGLQHLARAIRLGSATALTSATNRVDSEMVASRQAMSFAITVDACPHE
jgi:hypothetical protein